MFTRLIFIIIIIALLFGVTLVYRNLNYKKDIDKKIEKSNIVEKSVALPMGSIINYGEGKNNGHPLLLIHGQGGDWKVYSDSFLKLSKKYHIYAIDCYGHGKSSHNPENYNIVDNGDDIIWFIENVIKRETIISGHSSGGLLAIYVASKNNPLVSGVMLEDPPIFSTLKDYAPKTWAYLDSFKTINDYLTGSKDEPYDVYYLKNAL